MAGGKETPRQKMIGMMYLVLTALLALNVSKAILDAFVAIEENTQNSAYKNLALGDGGISDMKQAKEEKTDIKAKQKIQALIDISAKIDKMTAEQIKLIDKAKLDLLEYCGEDVKSAKPGDPLAIVQALTKNYSPAKLNLHAVQNKEEYDKPMERMIGAGAELNKPSATSEGMKIFNSISKFRCDIVQTLGTWKNGEKSFSVKASPINNYKDQKELDKLVTAMLKKNKNANNDESDDLKKIYTDLTLQEKVTSEEHGVIHWVGRTFDHSPVVAAMASLTSLEQSVLGARADAISLLKERAGTGEYSFNKVMPLAYGPSSVNQNEDFEVKVLMAAYDTENQPIVPNGVASDGVAVVKGRGSGSEVNMSGTISIRKKDGSMKTAPWEFKTIVMKPQGTVSLPELLVLYRGYKNVVQGVASGFPETKLSGSNVSLAKSSGGNYIGTPGAGKTATISVSGYNPVSKKSANLGTFTFQVKNIPRAEVFWGSARDGDKANKAAGALRVAFGDEIPLKGEFSCNKWILTVPGAPRAFSGSGGALTPEAKAVLNQVKPGTTVSFSVVYSGTGGSGRTASASFRL